MSDEPWFFEKWSSMDCVCAVYWGSLIVGIFLMICNGALVELIAPRNAMSDVVVVVYMGLLWFSAVAQVLTGLLLWFGVAYKCARCRQWWWMMTAVTMNVMGATLAHLVLRDDPHYRGG